MPDGGRSCHRSCHCSSIHSSIHYMVFAWFFHAFEAACLVMSGIGVGFSSSFLWASEGDVRHFFGGWFLDRLGLNPAGVWLFRLRAERRPELPRSCHCSSIHSSIDYMVFAWFFHGFDSIQPRPTLLFHGRALQGFPGSLNGFGAAWQEMSGRCVQKATLGSFSGDGLGRLGLNPAGVCHGFALLSPVWTRLF